jgi:hypothetical protein
MCVAKEITDRNKQYLEKRWSAFCASAGTKSEITTQSMTALMGMLVEAQPRLYQTRQGRILAERAIAADTNPPKVKDQVNMVYHYTGMKAAVLMRSYIRLGPLVLSIPSVLTQAKEFKSAYDALQESTGSRFPYTRLMGGGQDLNHALLPDVCVNGFLAVRLTRMTATRAQTTQRNKMDFVRQNG